MMIVPHSITSRSRPPTTSHAGQVSFTGWPSAAGCFPPISTANACCPTPPAPDPIDLDRYSTPDSCVPSSVAPATSTGPDGVMDQSIPRINPRTRPGPANASTSGSIDATTVACPSTLSRTALPTDRRPQRKAPGTRRRRPHGGACRGASIDDESVRRTTRAAHRWEAVDPWFGSQEAASKSLPDNGSRLGGIRGDSDAPLPRQVGGTTCLR